MTETSGKKLNWLAIVSILLALLLLVQTGVLFYFLNHREALSEKASNKKETSALARSHASGSSSPYPQNLFSNRTRQKSISSQSHTYSDPWTLFDEMQEDMGHMMGGLMAGLPAMMSQMNQHMGLDSMPLVDMAEKDNTYLIRVDIPGLDKNKIEITVRGEILTIQGVRETTNQEQTDSYYTQERSYGSFSRSLRLPGPVDDANVKADYQNGVLTITLPKISPEQASKKINIA